MKANMSDVSKFDLMKVIGQPMAAYIMGNGNGFKSDLVNAKNNDQLLTTMGDIVRIKKQMGDSVWLDGFKV